MAMYGQGVTRGRVAILGIDAAINQACAAITPGPAISTSYLFHYLSYNYERIRNLGHGAHQKNLSATLLKSVPILTPPMNEQQRIAVVMDAANAKLACEHRRRESLNILFQSLLHVAVFNAH